jgi:hypothetical protein
MSALPPKAAVERTSVDRKQWKVMQLSRPQVAHEYANQTGRHESESNEMREFQELIGHAIHL